MPRPDSPAGGDSAEYWWERAAADNNEDAIHNLELLRAELAG